MMSSTANARPPKRFQSAANLRATSHHKRNFLRGQFFYAPDIVIDENEILPQQPLPSPLPASAVPSNDNKSSTTSSTVTSGARPFRNGNTSSNSKAVHHLSKQIIDEEDLATSTSLLRRSKRQQSNKGVTKYKSATSFDSFVEDHVEDGLEARDTGTIKGRGVFTTKKFFRGDYIVEYAGELLTQQEANAREALYGRNHNIGCYMYYFKCGEKQMCIDATPETDRLGRLINHSRRHANCVPKTFMIRDHPRLIMMAMRDIEIGEELFYDYGERRKDVVHAFPWLNQ